MTFSYLQSILVIAAAFLALPAMPAHAGDDKGTYQTLHYIPCSEYVQDRKAPRGTGKNAVDEIYVSGWLSAFNYLTPNTYDILPQHDVNTVLVWLDKFCKDGPAKNIEGGLLEVTSELYPDRMQNLPAAATATAPAKAPPVKKAAKP